MSWNFQYDSPNAISAMLDEYGLAMTKKFGQNFLLSESVRKRIVDEMKISKDSTAWEIGPGLGAITSLMIETGAQITSFEIDHGFCRILEDQAFGDDPNFTLIEGDALKTWCDIWDSKGTPDVICGNLPYNVGSVVIASILEYGCRPERMVYTLQKEVAERLCAGPGSKNWSSLSILCQVDYDMKIVTDINKGAFFPVPNVVSSVITMVKKETPLVPFDERETFLMVIRDLFRQRRKTVRNNLLSGNTGKKIGREGVLDSLAAAGIKESERGEKLGIEEIGTLARAITARF